MATQTLTSRLADSPGLLTNLQAQVSSFVGREAELAEVSVLVGGSRLVTLTGGFSERAHRTPALANILRKLGLSSRAAAAAWGVRAGLV